MTSSPLPMEITMRMAENARMIARRWCGVAAGERVVILTDHERPPVIAQHLLDAVAECGAEAIIVVMRTPASAGYRELPGAVEDSLTNVDVVIAPTSKTVIYSRVLDRLCRDQKRTRLACMTGCSEAMLASDAYDPPFERINPIAKRVAQAFSDGRSIRITTPAGTNLTAGIEGRPGSTIDGQCTTPGVMLGLPTMEAFIAPLEDSVNGDVVIDASGSDGLGLIQGEPIRIRIRDGRATTIAGGTEARKLEQMLADASAESAYVVGEFGFGMNPGCHIRGTICEDEGKYGTWHMALGENRLLGGTNACSQHIDLVQWKPDVYVDDKIVFKDGVIHIEGLDLKGSGLETAAHS